MRADDFRGLTIQELDGRIEDMRKHLFNFRIQMQSNQLSNTNQLRTTRRDIARAMSVRKELLNAENQDAAGGENE